MQVRMALLRYLPAIIKESVRPMEKIDAIKIFQLEGLNGGGAGNGAGEHSGNLADQVVDSALRYRAQSPLIDSLLEEIGLEGGAIRGMTAALAANGADPSSS